MMTEIDNAYKEWSSICRMFNRKEDPAIYSHKELFDFAKDYHKHMMQVSKLPIHGVSKCACPPLVACEICGEEKNLDGDFWKNKKKHDC